MLAGGLGRGTVEYLTKPFDLNKIREDAKTDQSATILLPPRDVERSLTHAVRNRVHHAYG